MCFGCAGSEKNTFFIDFQSQRQDWICGKEKKLLVLRFIHFVLWVLFDLFGLKMIHLEIKELKLVGLKIKESKMFGLELKELKIPGPEL